MIEGKLYYVLLVLAWMYAMLRGGLPERVGAAILAVGSALTVAALPRWALRDGSLEVGVLLVDLACLAAFSALALRADRFWPIWVSALVGLGVLGHLARWIEGPELTRWAYAVSLTIWAYPMLALLAIGTWNHQRRIAGEADRVPPTPIAPRARA